VRRCTVVHASETRCDLRGRFIGERSPEHVQWCGQIEKSLRGVRDSITSEKKNRCPLGSPDQSTSWGTETMRSCFSTTQVPGQRGSPCGDRRSGADPTDRIGELHGKGRKVASAIWAEHDRLLPLTRDGPATPSVSS